ncbi:MAG TPA: GNAT family N-acetyltransferase [Thermomicrobiales bacterium]|nr:GNAT family N-acetyltransferase [Thermomicrobiales bacterium]
MNVQILSPDDRRWDAVLATAPHDFYALPRFAALEARDNDCRPVAALASEGDRHLLIPLLLRPVPVFDDALAADGHFDASSPYGYPGVVASPAALAGPDGDAFLAAALDGIIDALKAAGVVSIFLRLHPLIPVAVDALRQHGVVVDHGRTVSIDVRPGTEAILAGMRRSYAKHLRKLDRAGFTAEIDEECRPESIDAFVDVYTETMGRVGAAKSYYVDAAYVRDLYDAVDGRLAISLVRLGDDVAVAGMVTTVGGIVQDFLGGTRTAYLSQAPARLEVWNIACWAHTRGFHRFHLGGGVGGTEDSLFAFKSGFSPDRHLFQTARIIVDADVAHGLMHQWSIRAGRPAADPTGFFPAWRAALPDPIPTG